MQDLKMINQQLPARANTTPPFMFNAFLVFDACHDNTSHEDPQLTSIYERSKPWTTMPDDDCPRPL